MKKIISIILVLSFLLSFGVSAYGITNVSGEEEINVFIDPHLPKDIKLPTLEEIEGKVTIYSYPGPDGGTRVSGPYYRTYDNKTDSAVITEIIALLTGGLSSKLLTFITNEKIKVAVKYLVGKIFGVNITIPTSYVGTWVTASYSDTYEMYIYYATIVHYENSNYTSPKNVQYYEVGRSATLEY